MQSVGGKTGTSREGPLASREVGWVTRLASTYLPSPVTDPKGLGEPMTANCLSQKMNVSGPARPQGGACLRLIAGAGARFFRNGAGTINVLGPRERVLRDLE